MKKIFLFFALIAIAFSVSACTSKKPEVAVNNIINVNNAISSEEKVAPLSAAKDEDSNLVDDKTASAPASNPVQTNKTMLSPDKQADLTKTYSQAILKTSEGNITLKFYAGEAPITVNNFLNLAKEGFYNGVKFHRVMKDFMIQSGDPLTKSSDVSAYGTGGPGYKFKNEYGTHKLVAGNIAMANAGVDTNGSQFFIVTAAATPFLDGGYTNFGEVVSGMEVVRKIENAPVERSLNGELSTPLNYVTINSIKLIK